MTADPLVTVQLPQETGCCATCGRPAKREHLPEGSTVTRFTCPPVKVQEHKAVWRPDSDVRGFVQSVWPAEAGTATVDLAGIEESEQ